VAVPRSMDNLSESERMNVEFSTYDNTVICTLNIDYDGVVNAQNAKMTSR
jgi:hypothetical protein